MPRRVADLTPDRIVLVAEVTGTRPFRRRLLELGFVPGTPVRFVRRVAIGGFVELEVRGAHVSLRLDEADALTFEGSP